MRQNCKYVLCGDRDETINHIISKSNTLTQKEYNTRQDWVDLVIHRELYKKLEFNHMNQIYIHNTESVLENVTPKLLQDFGI